MSGAVYTMTAVRNLKKYRKLLLSLVALLGCLLVASLVRAFVQPASAMNTDLRASLGSLTSDELAYYCIRYGSHAPSVPAVCQSPALAAVTLVSVDVPALARRGGDCRTFDTLFRQYAWNAATAEAICQAESGGNPDAVSLTNDYGLMQLHNEKIFDPAQNIAAAYQKYQSQGWTAWTTYRSGIYSRFL